MASRGREAFSRPRDVPFIIDPNKMVRNKYTEFGPVILQMYAQGISCREICAALGCSPKLIYGVLHRNKDFFKNHRRLDKDHRVADSHAETILQLVREDKTYAEIAEATHLSISTIVRFVARTDAKKIKRRGKYRARISIHGETIGRMTEAGESDKRIAETTGLSVDQVLRYRRRHGYLKSRKHAVTEQQRRVIIEMAGEGQSWNKIRSAAQTTKTQAEKILKESGLWPKPNNFAYNYSHNDDPPWWPDPGAPTYNDDFVLKPEHRVRLEYVRYRRNIGRPIQHCVKERHRHAID